MRRLILLRPEPGLSASAARAEAMGLKVVRHALFAIEPIAATLPGGEFDALVLTSANAVAHGGDVLKAARHLPVYAVGEATAEAARAVGLRVAAVGRGGAEGLDLPVGRLLHLTGERHRALPGETVSVPVYRAVPAGDPLPDLAGAVVAVHSPAAGERLYALATARESTRIAAISTAAATACGAGWQQVQSATAPDEPSLLALAAALCQSAAR